MKDNPDLETLSHLLSRHPEAPESLGLFLSPSLKTSGYEATPTCCSPFAWTGGDGVHFSLADIGETAFPVVMTVPMNFDAPNMVLGKDLREFLALGLHTGYFTLEGLMYDRDAEIARITDTALRGSAGEALKDIGKTFGLVPWSNARNRLDELQAEFAKALK